MKLLKRIAISFSLYSRIPMPHFLWEDADMKYSLVFFPWVGIVIGGFSLVCYRVCRYLGMPTVMLLLLMGLIPIVITGGFHLDGFMDVTDAVNSYQDRNKKLEILKDPHVGAFAIIGLVKYLLLFAVALYGLLQWGTKGDLCLYAGAFFFSRALSGYTSLVMEKAKKDGMLYRETKEGNRGMRYALLSQVLFAILFMVWANWKSSFLVCGAACITLLYYKKFTGSHFGGVTGDTAGYLVTVSECAMTWAVFLGTILW